MRVTLGIVVATILVAGCRGDTAEVAWPEGSADEGRTAFVNLGCNSCHRVAGEDLPGPVATPEVPFVLGSEQTAKRSTEQLATAIMNPSHAIVEGVDREAVTSGERSRMGDYSEAMTVAQLADILAFLQSKKSG